MKKSKSIIISFVIIILVFSNISYANNNIVLEYNANSKSFDYVNTENTDILKNFKDLMPGDKREQIITIQSKNIKEQTKMYLKMNNKGMEELLLNKISFKILKGEEVIYDNKINKDEETMANLHTFNKDESFDLKVVLEVPEEVGNEVQELALSIEWKFIVEDSGDYIDIDIPQTSDNIMIYVYVLVASLTMFLIIVLRIYNKKNKE